MVRGFTVCGCPNALRKKRFAASASRLAVSGDGYITVISRPRDCGNLYSVKQRPEQKIDPVVALMMAIGRAMKTPVQEGSTLTSRSCGRRSRMHGRP